MPAMLAHHAGDPRKELLKRVGDISDIEIFHNGILVAIYHRPKAIQLAGGKTLHLPDNLAGKTGEDRYQGKVGMVIAKGPQAFVPDERADFAGIDVSVGDWVVFRRSDGWDMTLVRGPGTDDNVLCTLLHEQEIRARILSPDSVW